MTRRRLTVPGAAFLSPQATSADPLMPVHAGGLARAARRLVNRLGATGLLMGSATGQRLRQAVRASLHVAQPVRLLLGSVVAPGRTGRYTVPAHTASGRPLTVVVRHRTDDVLVFNEIFHHGVYRMPDEVQARLARTPSPRVVDLGANIGLFSLWIAGELPEARVVAVEPDPQNLIILQSQLTANALQERVEVVRAAAGASDGTVSFAAGHFIHSGVVDDGASGSIRVERRDVLPLVGGADLAKIDIEGSEWEILTDPRFATLRVPALVLEWHATDAHPEACAAIEMRDLLRGAGYEIVRTASEAPNCGVLWAVAKL